MMPHCNMHVYKLVIAFLVVVTEPGGISSLANAKQSQASDAARRFPLLGLEAE